MKFHPLFLTFFLLLACDKSPDQTYLILPANINSIPLTYLALGDSYTIGESVAQTASFPYQLAEKLRSNDINVSAAPKIIAKTGWTTDELQAAIKTANLNKQFDIVTLLIGVNNQYRGYPQSTYRKEFKELLQTAIDFAGKNKKHVFVVSIPDWGVTPFGLASGKSKEVIAKEIDEFNAIAKEETLALGISYTDITPASRNAFTDASLVAGDGLHPSGKMYGEWAVKVAAAVSLAFK